MALRWGPGPVFFYECLTTSRRWQVFALRTLAALLPSLGLALVWWAQLGSRPLTISNLASTGESFFYALVGTQLALILLAAPACTAGSICLDKARGTLLHMLITDLSDTEIILGKLAAQLLAVLGLVAAVVPVLFGAILLGGIEPSAAVGAVAVSAGVAVFTSTLALTLSVWMRKTYEVLLLVYLFLALLLLCYPIWLLLDLEWNLVPPPDWLRTLNPFWIAFLPYLEPGTRCLSDQGIFLAGSLTLSALLALLAVLRVRAVVLRQSAVVQRRRRRLPLWLLLWRGLPGPSLNRHPILWREWHRKQPSRWSMAAWSLYGAIALLFTLLVAGNFLNRGQVRDLAPMVNALQVSIGLLMLSIASVTALGEERVRGSLDVLLTTPLSTLEILQGKWWGAYRPVLLLTVLPGVVAASVAVPAGNGWGVPLFMGLILAYGAVLTSLGLALSIWIPRPGRAQVVSVILFVLMTIAPILPLIISHHSPETEGLAMASPFFGPGQITDLLGRSWGSYRERLLIWNCVWLMVYLGAAALLFVLSLLTFGRCVGRGTETILVSRDGQRSAGRG